MHNFLTRIHELIQRLKYDDLISEEKKLEMVAFGVLVMIDGENPFCGPYALKPLDEDGNEGEDIAGDLHNNFYSIKDKLKMTVKENEIDDHSQIVPEGEELETTLLRTSVEIKEKNENCLQNSKRGVA